MTDALKFAAGLIALDAAKKYQPSGPGGQMCGSEMYRIVASGNTLGVLYDAAAELRRLHRVELAFNEWIDKSEWVQDTSQPKELGMHRADVLRQRIEALQAEVESMRADAARYRWLKENPLTFESGVVLWFKWVDLDREIDAAMKGGA